MHSPAIVIVTPALADANNGNWQTARRWARMLSHRCRVRLAAQWSDGDEDLMIALHARRSAGSVAAWRARRPAAPLVVVLTGTDLYRDIAGDAAAQASLQAADRLVVLNELGARTLPAPLRPRTQVVLQSCSARQRLAKTGRHLRALMVGHLRDEKSPRTYFDAARRLAPRADIRLDHVGAALDPALGAEAAALAAADPRYRWLGGLAHAATRRRIQAAHLLVHPSRMEGGAHVVIEAVRSGTPVLATRIDGNLGLLGEAYDGYVPVGDAAALAALIQRLRDDPAMLYHLQQQCEARAGLFDPVQESATLLALVGAALTQHPPSPTQHRDPP
ncbi:MAG: TIGR04348 family glycosyltransferase [Burkholderiales bacterium]|nr:TIGR04348 family glycosyltransferase [Burkholderiales bacterium]MDE1929415.1 TIGR04348 family glycosyltransferase [Burkholderiales bacterium]